MLTIPRPVDMIAVALAASMASTPSAAQVLDITELWSTTGSASIGEIAFVAGMGAGPGGSVWVSEGMGRGYVMAISADGSRVRIAARTGGGPGEVDSPTLISARPDGGVAIYDIGHQAIQVFGPDGSFIERIRLAAMVINPKGFAALRSGGFVISGGIIRNGYSIHHFGADGELVASWHPVPETQDPMAGVMVAGGPVQELDDGSILFSQAAPHLIVRFAGPEGAAHVVASEPRILPPIGDDFIRISGSGDSRVQRFDWFFPQSKGVFPLPEGRILNVIWLHERQVSVWEVYDQDGRRIVAREIDRAYEPWAVAANGDVFASYRDSDTDEHSDRPAPGAARNRSMRSTR